MKNLFTPLLSETSADRIRMSLSDEDNAKIERGKWSATVTDQNTGRTYEVKGFPCGDPCYCDAVIVRELLVRGH